MLPFHDVVYDFPPLSKEDREALKESIRSRGECTIPLLVWQGKVIDGRHRAEILDELNLPVPMKSFVGTEAEAIQHALDVNVRRRQLDASKSALAAGRVCLRLRALAPNGAAMKANGTGRTVATAAKQAGVAARQVDRALAVLQRGTPELQKAVDEGVVSVSDAATVTAEPPEAQDAAVELVKKGRAKTLSQAAKKVTKPPLGNKPKTSRQKCEHALGELIRALDRAGAYERLKPHLDEIKAGLKGIR